MSEARWRDEIVPNVVDGLKHIKSEEVCWELSLRVPDAIAHSGRPCQIEGASADAACFVALIGSALGINTRRDTLVTGTAQLQSESLGLVQALPEKLQAAAYEKTIRRFVHAPTDQDQSAGWTPDVLLRWDEACSQAEQHVRRVPCTSLSRVLNRVLPIDSRVIAALKHGQFNSTPIEQAPVWVNMLCRVDQAAWRQRLDRRVQLGHKSQVQRLLQARITYELEQGRYPSGIGVCLRGALRTVPAGKRRLKLKGYLISTDLLEQCAELATEADQDDLKQLAIASHHQSSSDTDLNDLPIEGWKLPGAGERVDWLLECLTELESVKRIDRMLDEARMSFGVEPRKIWTTEALIDVFTSFYAHLYRSLGQDQPASLLSANAIKLVRQAYVREGGLRAAVYRAKEHVDGGLRGVLDRMTAVVKAELRTSDSDAQKLLAIDDLDDEGRVAQTKHLMDRMSPVLRKRLRGLSPELLATKLPELVDITVKGTNETDQLLRGH
jgi:hypothetical protein